MKREFNRSQSHLEEGHLGCRELQGYGGSYSCYKIFIGKEAYLEYGLVPRPAVEGIEYLEHGQGGKSKSLSPVNVPSIQLAGEHPDSPGSHEDCHK